MNCILTTHLGLQIMTRTLKVSVFAAMLTLASSGVIFAGPFEDGLAAYRDKDFPTSRRLWIPLAAQGDVKAESWLGMMYAAGNGIPQDYKEAVRLYRLAALRGDALAQQNLGYMYFNGTGVLKDNIRAYMWLNISSSRFNRDIVAANMTASEIEKAQELTETCQLSQFNNCGELESEKALPGTMPVVSSQSLPSSSGRQERVSLSKEGGTYAVSVLINGIIPLYFKVDSGAADVSIPADVVLTLMRTGSLKKSDFVGNQKYELADGSTVTSRTFIIRSLKVGNQTITNVKGSVADVNGSLLLGQSFLEKFKSWSMDNVTHELVLLQDR
jgi:predicted aspartyl protease